jgi:hypothetical protein
MTRTVAFPDISASRKHGVGQASVCRLVAVDLRELRSIDRSASTACANGRRCASETSIAGRPAR